MTIANLLLKLAVKLNGNVDGRELNLGEDGDGRKANKPSSVLNPPFAPLVEAMLTASPVWGIDEARGTAAFLNSPAGQLFSKRIRSVAAHVAIEGANTGGTRCATTANTIHSAGVSAGWNECVRYIHSLGGSATGDSISRVSGDQDTGQVGRSNLNDSQQPEDEAALVERLSP